MNKKIKIILFLILLPNILVWAITREDVLSNAQPYSNLNWTVNTVNTEYSIFSVKGKNITGEAYSWGGKDRDIGVGGRHLRFRVETQYFASNVL